MSVSNNFKRKSFAGQNASAAPSNGTQIKRPKRYDNYPSRDWLKEWCNYHSVL
jgi:hypothetical protein